ncbi:hypothetical protein ACFSTH_13175 [Paenibacillus yanchengensis]|uniref:YqbQ/XkdQ domain-containing protein n=1 Tax=Paenibacillus yanchengensis TaxID=2035833 RepID=A0ABW4YNC5_9BACL
MIEVVLINRDGERWDISELVGKLKIKTSRIGKAGSLSLDFLKAAIYQSKMFKYNNGDVVEVRKDGKRIFYGYIFEIKGGRDEQVSLTVYDQIRYLMNTETYVFENVTATQIVERIAKEYKLTVGKLADTEHVITHLVADAQKLLDIIDKAIVLTFHHKGKDYCLFDDAGNLSLRSIDEEVTDIVIGPGSLLYDYSVSESIDEDTYNQFKLYRDNEETGKRDIFMVKDSNNIARWGLLQHHESIDDKLNTEQISELLNNLALLKNRETISLQVDAIGNIAVRAGMRVRIQIPEYSIDEALLVNECTHQFDGAEHTMSLELKVIKLDESTIDN